VPAAGRLRHSAETARGLTRGFRSTFGEIAKQGDRLVIQHDTDKGLRASTIYMAQAGLLVSRWFHAKSIDG